VNQKPSSCLTARVENPSVQIDHAKNTRTSSQCTRGEALDYEKVQTFESLPNAKKFLKAMVDTWVYKNNYNTSEGCKYIYKCNHSTCKVRLHILAHNTSSKATVLKTTVDHNHLEPEETGLK